MKRSKSRRDDEERDDSKTPGRNKNTNAASLQFYAEKPKMIKHVIDPNGPYYNGLKRQMNDKESISVHHPFFKKNNMKFETKNAQKKDNLGPLTDRSKTQNVNQFKSNSLTDHFSLPDVNLISQKLNLRNDGFNNSRDYRDAAYVLTKNYENNKFTGSNNNNNNNNNKNNNNYNPNFFDGVIRNDNASLLKLQYHMDRNSNLTNKFTSKPNDFETVSDKTHYSVNNLRKLGYVTQDYKNIIPPNRKTPSSFAIHSRYEKESNNSNNVSYNPKIFTPNPNKLLSRLGYANDYFDNILL